MHLILRNRFSAVALSVKYAACVHHDFYVKHCLLLSIENELLHPPRHCDRKHFAVTVLSKQPVCK